jgi:DNA polymerase zeta
LSHLLKFGEAQEAVQPSAFSFPFLPPTPTEVVQDLDIAGLPTVEYRDPYFSRLGDAPRKPKEYAGRLFSLKGGSGIASLPPWESTPLSILIDGTSRAGRRGAASACRVYGWEYAGYPVTGPPSRRSVLASLTSTKQNNPTVKSAATFKSQVYGTHLKFTNATNS